MARLEHISNLHLIRERVTVVALYRYKQSSIYTVSGGKSGQEAGPSPKLEQQDSKLGQVYHLVTYMSFQRTFHVKIRKWYYLAYWNVKVTFRKWIIWNVYFKCPADMLIFWATWKCNISCFIWLAISPFCLLTITVQRKSSNIPLHQTMNHHETLFFDKKQSSLQTFIRGG